MPIFSDSNFHFVNNALVCFWHALTDGSSQWTCLALGIIPFMVWIENCEPMEYIKAVNKTWMREDKNEGHCQICVEQTEGLTFTGGVQ